MAIARTGQSRACSAALWLAPEFLLNGREIHGDIAAVSDRQRFDDMQHTQLRVILVGQDAARLMTVRGRAEVNCHEDVL